MRTVSRMYDDYGDAVAVVKDLEVAPLKPNRDISLLANQNARGRELADHEPETRESHAGTGAGVGSVIGGAIGILTGLGLMAIPGVGPVVAAGWLVSLLAGVGAGAAVGGLIGALVKEGVPHEEAEVYEEGVRRGSTLVAVRCDETDVGTVEGIMDRRPSANWRTRRQEYATSGWTPAR